MQVLFIMSLSRKELYSKLFSRSLVLALSLVNSAMSQTKTEQAAADSRQRIAGPVTMAMLGPGLYFPLPLPDTQLCRQLRPESGEKPGPCPLLHTEPLASLRRLLSSRLIDAPWNPSFDQYLAPHYVTTSLVQGKLTLCHIH